MPVSVIADTLERDTALIAAWRADASYSYCHDLVTPEMDIFDWMAWQIWKLIDKLSQLPASEGGFKFLWIGIGVLCLVLLFLFIYRMHPGIFARSPKKNVMSVAAGETIYGVDFQHEIEKAVGLTLDQGWRTADIFTQGTRLCGTKAMGQAVAGNIRD